MSENITETEQTEEFLYAFEASDEALEAAAQPAGAAFTLGACTGLSVCPE